LQFCCHLPEICEILPTFSDLNGLSGRVRASPFTYSLLFLGFNHSSVSDTKRGEPEKETLEHGNFTSDNLVIIFFVWKLIAFRRVSVRPPEDQKHANGPKCIVTVAWIFFVRFYFLNTVLFDLQYLQKRPLIWKNSMMEMVFRRKNIGSPFSRKAPLAIYDIKHYVQSERLCFGTIRFFLRFNVHMNEVLRSGLPVGGPDLKLLCLIGVWTEKIESLPCWLHTKR